MDRAPQHAAMESPPDIERVSVLLSKLIERKVLGTREILDCRRRAILGHEYIINHYKRNREIVLTGSTSEGVNLPDSDFDFMFIDKDVEVIYPGDSIPPDSTQKTLLYAAAADCRPGFVTLQLGHTGRKISNDLHHSFVPVGHSTFVSSDMFREFFVKGFNNDTGFNCTSNGPSSSNGTSDVVHSFHMSSWPREANQWVTRPRLYGWPTQTVIDKIVQRGCHVVPVGDKCSMDTFLQWRLSFVTAERLLVHSFNHTQMKVYFLLKYFLQQMKHTIRITIGKEDDDILCSYHLKTVMFLSVENSHPKLWQERNLFYCFWFCFNILVSCVSTGQLPQYFIPTNNLFQRKVHGQNQHKIFHILDSFYRKKLLCLLNVEGTCCRVNLLECVSNPEVQATLMRAQTIQETECTQDMFVKDIFLSFIQKTFYFGEDCLTRSFTLLMKSHTELEEVMSFLQVIDMLSHTAKQEAHQNLTGRLTNKARYQTLRKCQHRLTLCASMGTYILELATLFFLTGNYSKALQMCQHITSQPYFNCQQMSLPKQEERMYMKQYCGKGYTTIDRLKKILQHYMGLFEESIYLPHLHLEVSQNISVLIPPLPYALFLSFLCCHELRDRRGCDEAMCNMIKLIQSHDCQKRYWINHTMLGICFQTIGDYPKAISAYLDSANAEKLPTQRNPALERIDALLRFTTK